MASTVTRPHCLPRFYPAPGHANTFQHDKASDGRYYLVSVGRSVGVYTSWMEANTQTMGFTGAQQRMCRTWTGEGGVQSLWRQLCDTYHIAGCPSPIIPDGWTAPTAVFRTHVPVPADSVLAHPAVIELSDTEEDNEEDNEGEGDVDIAQGAKEPELWAVEGFPGRLFSRLKDARLARTLVETTPCANLMCSTNIEGLCHFSQGHFDGEHAEFPIADLMWAVASLPQQLYTSLESARSASPYSDSAIMASANLSELRRFAEGVLF